MTKRMVVMISTNLLTACLSIAFLRPAIADTDTNKGGASDKGGVNKGGASDKGGVDKGGADKGGAIDKGGASGRTGAGATLNASDKAFIMEVARDNQSEIELGQVAANHGSSSDVIKFGQQMVSEHTRMHNELKQLAAKKDVTIPQEVDSKTKTLKDRFMQTAQRAGAEFDREYMKKMLQDHEQEIALFQRAANHGTDPELQAWAKKALPSLQEHLRMARNINDNLKKNQSAAR